MSASKKFKQLYSDAFELVHGLIFGHFDQVEERDATVAGETIVFTDASTSRKKQAVPVAEPFSSVCTQGIRVEVRSVYLPNHSQPEQKLFTFAYTVTISNEGKTPAKLETRHWIITDGFGTVQEVKGEGVVGEKPHLNPGQSFQYTSGCQLRTPVGTMHGTYQMHRDDGGQFDAEVATFSLATSTTSDSMKN